MANFEHSGDLNWSQEFGEPRIKALQSAQQTPALPQLKSTEELDGEKKITPGEHGSNLNTYKWIYFCLDFNVWHNTDKYLDKDARNGWSSACHRGGQEEMSI